MPNPKSPGAERQRLYIARVKGDASRHEECKAKEKEHWKRRQLVVAESDRATRHQRKLGREKQQRFREKKKTREAELRALEINTSTVADNDELPLTQSIQKDRGRKRVRRDRSELYRKMRKLENDLENEKRRTQIYRKKLQRKNIAEEQTPQKEIRKSLRKCKVTPHVRKLLTFSTAMINGMKKRYGRSKSNKEKQMITNLVQTHLKKYRMMGMAHGVLGIPPRVEGKMGWSITTYRRATHLSVGQRWSIDVRDYLCRDDNSRITTSKQDTITRNGVKAQRRILSESMLRLHGKFAQERPLCQMSYSLFCRLRPFYIVPPTNKDRETCLCRLHENGRMIVIRMAKADIFPPGISSIEDVVALAVCPEPQQQCYERTCTTCANNLQDLSSDCTDTITWHQWATVKEDRIIRNKTVTIQRTVKKSIDGTAKQLCESFKKCSQSYVGI